METDNIPFWPQIQSLLEASWAWLGVHVFALGNLLQLLIIGAVFATAWLLSKPTTEWVARLHPPDWYHRHLARLTPVFKTLTRPLLALVLLWFAVAGASVLGENARILRAALNLVAAWVVIRTASSFVASRMWSKSISTFAWSVAALNILGLLSPTMEVLDSIAFSMGDFRLSLLGLVKAVIVVGILVWGAGLASRLAEKRVNTLSDLSPSARVLFGKAIRIALYVLAILIGLNSVGIDLTALAVFSGAVGLGLGFGLQKVISNFISGVILLLDKSVKPGDVIVVSGTYGTINSLRARYVSVITRDGIEHLIPNEDLISQRVENWSFSNKLVRQRVKIGIAYGSDVLLARALVIEQASQITRVLSDPAPMCHLIELADSALMLELRYWLEDPENGVGNVRSTLLLGVLEAFKQHNIEIPFPQRDIHIRTSSDGVPLSADLSEAVAKATAEAATPQT